MKDHLAAAVTAFALAASLTAACAKTHAKVTPDMPALDVPPPPPRIVEPTESETPPPVPLAKEPARHTPPTPRQNRPAVEPPRPEVRPAEQPKTEPPPEPPKPEETPRPAPPTTLQTTPTQAEGEVERNIRGVLARARGDLGRVDYRHLNADARTQYDQAKRFVEQADDALRAKNLLFARNLADKAAAIAAQLAGR